jgi:transcription initiation factor TFIIIB Brf1 subunit/transcription initiation factor TFIIB
MLTSTRTDGCAQCLGRIVDVGEEMVCSSCGMVTLKEVIEPQKERVPQLNDYTKQALGSYLGPIEYASEEMFSRGFASAHSSYRYLKALSDYSHKESTGVYNCGRLIERICEKLVLPKVVVGDAVTISKSVMEMRRGHGEITIAAIAAFSIINACKRLRVTSVGVKDIMDAHRNLGYKVKASVIIQISINSSIRGRPRRAEEYLGSVIVHLQPMLDGDVDVPVGYFNTLHEASRIALESLNGPCRGGHNPRALAATAVYAGEMALATVEGRKKIVSQRQIAECVGVAEYTVRGQFVEMFKPRMERLEESIRSRTSPQPRPSTEMYRTLPQAQSVSW